MDLNKIDFAADAELGYTFTLLLPNDEETDVKLTVIGDLSDAVQNFEKTKFLSQTSKGKGKTPNDAEFVKILDDTQLRGALVRLIGWSGITENDKPVPFSSEKAKEYLTKHPWIRDQIYAAAGEAANFTPMQLTT